MKTWALMYLIIWVVLLEMVIALFPILGYTANLDLHVLVGLVVVVMAYLIFIQIRGTSCPDRIKRITKATFQLAVFDGVLGVPLYLTDASIVGVPFKEVIVFLHFVLGVTIIAQASSSAAAYDMWEEKEFAQAPDVASGAAHTS